MLQFYSPPDSLFSLVSLIISWLPHCYLFCSSAVTSAHNMTCQSPFLLNHHKNILNNHILLCMSNTSYLLMWFLAIYFQFLSVCFSFFSLALLRDTKFLIHTSLLEGHTGWKICSWERGTLLFMIFPSLPKAFKPNAIPLLIVTLWAGSGLTACFRHMCSTLSMFCHQSWCFVLQAGH